MSRRPLRKTWPLALLLLLLTLGASTFALRGGASSVADPAPLEAAVPPPAETALLAAEAAKTPVARPAEEEWDGPRILVSLERRRLWLVKGRDTLLNAPVAIGMGQDFVFEGRRYRFETPRGERRIIGKAPEPIWTPPDWHYLEKAHKKGLQVVRLEKDSSVELADGTFIVVQNDQVGRINQFGNFAPFTPGVEIMFDDKLFMPPLTSAQRKVPDALGPYKLDMGDGYLIHGTHMYNHDSIGDAVSHGCVRMNNSDLERLYPMVPRGTPVTIF